MKQITRAEAIRRLPMLRQKGRMIGPHPLNAKFFGFALIVFLEGRKRYRVSQAQVIACRGKGGTLAQAQIIAKAVARTLGTETLFCATGSLAHGAIKGNSFFIVNPETINKPNAKT